MSSQPESERQNPSLSSRLAGIIDQCSAGLHRYLGRRLRNPEDAKDLAQETWLRLCKASSETIIKEPDRYMSRIAGSVIVDWARDRKRDCGHSQECVDASIDVASEALADRPEDLLHVTQFLDKELPKLPKMQAAVLLLFARDGLSREEVAERLGLTLDTVKKYLTSSRAQLRLKYRETEEQP